jgi:hypothetical protein
MFSFFTRNPLPPNTPLFHPLQKTKKSITFTFVHLPSTPGCWMLDASHPKIEKHGNF